MRTLCTSFAIALTVCGLIGGVWADDKKEAPKAEAKDSTKMVIKDMTWGGCAKKVSKALEALPGVESVLTDVKEHTATVTPKKDTKLSPKELWEAVVKAGYTPSLSEGPGGKFEKMPEK